MQYEDFPKAKDLYYQIGKAKETLAMLESNTLLVKIIEEPSQKTVSTIGVSSFSRHPLYTMGRDFIENIKSYLQKEIESCTKELEAL